MMLVFLWSSCITEGEKVGQELAVGDKVPEFSVKMENGETVTAEDLKGRVSLIVFFHTSCTDCQKQLPVLQAFYECYPQYPLVCISREENADSVSAYWAGAGFTMPYSAQEDRSVYQLFAYQRIPRIYVVDTEGVICRIFTDSSLAALEDLLEAIETG